MSRRLRDMGTHCSRHTVRKLLERVLKVAEMRIMGSFL